jgi:predicted nucleic-acid-binding Zn-ribbon protein
MQKCLRCGGTEFDNGKLVTTGAYSLGAMTGMDVLYKSSKERKNQKIWIGTITCLNCGHIELFLNPKQLK